MKQLDRRQWLRSAGLTGAFALLGGSRILADDRLIEDLFPTPGPSNIKTIRLSSNENPFGPSQKVREAMIKGFDMACRYPFSYGRELEEMIAEKEGVTPDHLVLTAGSTEGLKMAGLVYGMEGGEIVAPSPTFNALMSYAEQFGAFINSVPVDDNHMHDLGEMDRRISSRTSLVYICNPNNPTGMLEPGSRLKDFCTEVSKRTVVFVDEAYFDFITEPGYPSMIDLVKAGQNVIVARTFSKVYGLAGLRIGYLIARPDITSRLTPKGMGFLNMMAIPAAKAALEDREFYQFSLKKNDEAKEMIYTTLDSLKLEYTRTHTNFVFFKTGREINGLISEFRKDGIEIGRPFPPLTKYCRISTGTIEETRAFCETLKRVMAG